MPNHASIPATRRKGWLLAAAVMGLLMTGPVLAADMPDLAKKNGCSACHAIDKKLVEPAWMDVSKKYKGDAGAASKLDQKILKGGSGVWGTMPMPGNPKLSAADRQTLVSFILAWPPPAASSLTFPQ